MNEKYFISTDNSKLNIELIYDFLKDAYWSKGRSIETVKQSIANSLCFGVYQDYKQIGFARVVTDYAVFAWILDVFILPEYRNLGLSKLLMDSIMKHEKLQNMQRWGLCTNDAHGLYEKYGFTLIKRPELFMEIVSKPK